MHQNKPGCSRVFIMDYFNGIPWALNCSSKRERESESQIRFLTVEVRRNSDPIQRM
jgi:hypothetical protein